MNNITLRKRKLSLGWYPQNPELIYQFIQNIDNNIKKEKTNNKIAAIVPHAGWSFSGSLAVESISNLSSNPDTIVIIGGHLPTKSPILYSPELVFETPLGNITADTEFISNIKLFFNMQTDYSNDNSVEVLLPILKYYYNNSKLVWLRIGSGNEAIDLGIKIHSIAKKLKRKIVVLGSTDLTHYGSVFSFSPKGAGSKAINWVKNSNDKDIVNNMLKMNCKAVLASASNNKSACSPGGAVAAIKFAELSGINSGELIGYKNSFDISPSESFVGYTGIVF